MKDEYISREYLVEHLTACFQNGRPMHSPELNEVLSMVADVPAADVAPVVPGEWGFDGISWTCSECGEYALLNKRGAAVKSNFCPNCGADMRTGDNP